MKFNSTGISLQCRGFECSPALAQRVEQEHQKLVKLAPNLLGCRVTLSREHRHRQQGRPFEVHIELLLPGTHELAATRHDHEDPYVAIRDAFMAMHQQLEALVGRRQERRRRHGKPQIDI